MIFTFSDLLLFLKLTKNIPNITSKNPIEPNSVIFSPKKISARSVEKTTLLISTTPKRLMGICLAEEKEHIQAKNTTDDLSNINKNCDKVMSKTSFVQAGRVKTNPNKV